jgi:LysR family transcriptional regulator, transcriptional activator of the cysJI operon
MSSKLARQGDRLFYFYQVGIHGSLHAAGRFLGLSAPTLSTSIKELEGDLETKLFDRSSRGVSLTAQGRLIFDFYQQVYRQMQEFESQLQDLEVVTKKHLRIGTFSSIAVYFWPMVFEHMKFDSHISYSITVGRSLQILEKLVKKEIDIAVTVGSMKHGSLIREELYKDEFSFFFVYQKKRI